MQTIKEATKKAKRAIRETKKSLSYLCSFDAEELEPFARAQEEKTEGFFNRAHFSELLPYRFYDQEKGLFVNKSSYGFCFQFSPLLAAGDQEKNEIEDLIEKLFWEGGACQFLFFADPFVGDWMDHWSTVSKGAPEIFEKVFSKRKSFYRRENLSDSPEGIIPLRKFSVFFSYSVPKKDEEPSETLIRKLQSQKKYAESMLRRVARGKECVAEVKPKNLIKLTAHLSGMDLSTRSPAPRGFSPVRPINEQISTLGGISVCSHGCVFHGEHEDMFFKMLELEEAPPAWDFRANLELIGGARSDEYRIQTPFFLHYGVYYPQQLSLNAKIVSKDRLVRGQMGTLSFLRKNPEMLKEREQYGEAMRRFDRGGKYLTTRLNLGVWGRKERFEEAVEGVISLYKSNGLFLRHPRFVHLDDFVRSMPMVWGENDLFRYMKNNRSFQTTMTGKAAHFAPILADFSGASHKGIPLVSRRGQLSFFNHFAGIKAHTSVIGPTGTGKSVFLNELFFHQRAKGAQVFVIDKGGSFQNLCDLLGGQYIDVRPDQSLHLNPFSFMPDDRHSAEAIEMSETLQSIVRTIYKPKGELSNREKVFLDQATQAAFMRKGNQARIDDIFDYIKKDLEIETDINKSIKEAMLGQLAKYSTRGSAAKWLYGKHQIDLEKDFVVIETNQMDGFGEFKNVILQSFFLRVEQAVYQGDRSREKNIAVDECHNQINAGDQWAGIIAKWAREIRKLKAALILATQNIGDFTKNPNAAAAFFNCEWLVNLGDGGGTVDALKGGEFLELADYEKEIFRGLTKSESFSEVAIRSASQKLTTSYRFRLDPFSLKLFSTKGNDYERFKFLNREGYTIESTVNWLVQLEKEFKAFDKQDPIPMPVKDHLSQLLYRKRETQILKFRTQAG